MRISSVGRGWATQLGARSSTRLGDAAAGVIIPADAARPSLRDGSVHWSQVGAAVALAR